MKKKILFLSILFISLHINAQYFGGNKPRYDEFDFKVYETPKLELYSYIKNDSLRNAYLNSGERWFKRHFTTFKDTFDYKIPIVLYNNHADFQQTTAISGEIGVGTGGVTEALKTRIVMPVRPSFGQTDHVLGHEMVHAFQYNLIKSDDSLSFNNLANVQLWMVEGMAEYFSLGRYDGHTAMWMRDAVLHNDFPEIKDLYKSKYFPYRYGQDFWAYIGGTYGDDKIIPLFYETLKTGFKPAVKKVLFTSPDTLSHNWKISNDTYYKQFLKGRDSLALGRVIFDEKNSGTMNVSPVISPDGKKMVFLSEKNVLSMDLYVVDLQTNKTRRIASKTMNNHIDAIDAYESAGTWSADSKQFAFVVFKKGKNQLAIVNIDKKKVTKIIDIPELQAFSYPAWSPDGKSILLLGQDDGVSDLFLYHFDTKKVERLTDDPYAELQPSWSKNGQKIVFSTDYYYLKRQLYPIKYHIGIFDLQTNTKTYPNIFAGANNMNPQFSKEADEIFFVSDFDGFRDLYRFDIETENIKRMTKFYTGISGITKFSPAFTINYSSDKIIYNYFLNHEYLLVENAIGKFYNSNIDDNTIRIKPSLLPPEIDLNTSRIERLLRNKYGDMEVAVEEKQYKPKFKLDYVSNIGVGINSSSMYGTGMMGGVSMIFSDILGKHQLYTAASLNGEVYDFALMGAYFNQSKKVGWGGSLSHIPYTNYYQTFKDVTLTNNSGSTINLLDYKIYTIRMFEEKLGLFSSYPISKTKRFELGGSLAYYSYKITSHNFYYTDYTSYLYGYQPVYYEKIDEEAPDGFSFHEVNTAFVGDNSVFGMTAPMKGERYRVGVQKFFGKSDMATFTFDYRKYIFLKPVTFAFKLSHLNRFGTDAEKNYMNGGILPPLYLGYDFYVRGYTYSAMYDSSIVDGNSLKYTDLMGSKMLLGNFEIRIPFTGPKRLALIKSGFFFTDLNFFVDAGIIWNAGNELGLKKDNTNANLKYPIYSTGVSTRINLFGQIIIQPYYAFPLALSTGSKGYFGINFYPGF